MLLGSVAGGVVIATNHTSASSAIQSPTEANSVLYAAAVASGSLHYTNISSGSVGGRVVAASQSGDIGRSEGVQYMASSLGDYEVIVINNMAYMKADLTMLENTFGYSPTEAAPYVNRWIGFAPTDSPYGAVAADVTVGTTWNNPSVSPTDDLPQTPEAVSGVSSLGGRSVQSVRYSLHGTNKASNASYSGTETISFSATDPHLPSSLTEQISGTSHQQSSTERVRMTFSGWGEAVSVTAPTGSIPFSTIPGPTATA